ncbi:hypothetical protein HFN89_05825 [Rhizobium laguerreae]|nr:hypothetical protein [Rhizobium laguerreae]
MTTMQSVHHRMPTALHHRLKMISFECRLPLTDLMNQAAREWIERYDAGMGGQNSDEVQPSIPARTSALRIAKKNGDYHSAVSGISKALLVDIAKFLSIEADNRMSRDSAVSALFDAL